MVVVLVVFLEMSTPGSTWDRSDEAQLSSDVSSSADIQRYFLDVNVCFVGEHLFLLHHS